MAVCRTACILFLFGWMGALISPSVLAFGGKMTPILYPQRSVQWQVKEPKVVVAFGLIQPSLVRRYSQFAATYFQDRLREINENITIRILSKATGTQVVKMLMDPETVGFIFVSHTYRTEYTHSTVMVGADGHDLPHNILSAAT